MGATTVATPGHRADDLGAPPGRARRIGAALAGPTLIVAGVLFALRGFVFADRLSDAHPDILSFWLPRFSFLGRSIAAGHVPLWNPFEMAGYRFAADPQGGWLYLVPMTLFSRLSPAVAMRAFIVANPLIAGLALFSFLRIERLSRLAATAGGLSLAMLMSTSEIAISMPFAGAMAWTCVALAGAAGYRRARRWSARVGWIALGALGWSQVATAHLSHGLVVCTALLTAYLVAGLVADISARGGEADISAREGEADVSARGREADISRWASAGSASARAAIFLVAMPLLSLAVLLPRVDALEASSLATGYDRLGDAIGVLGGSDSGSIQDNGVWAAWPFGFGATPGAYAGAVILLGVPLALRTRRHRGLLWAFGGALALTWLLMLDPVVTSPAVRDLFLRIPFGDVYLHNPGRMRYLAVIAVPVLGAIGLQGLREDPLEPRAAARWLAAGAFLWLGMPLIAFAYPLRFVVLALGLAAGAWALFQATARRRPWAWIVVGSVLTVELLVSAVYSQLTPPGDTIRLNLEAGVHPNLIPQPLPLPRVDASAFVSPTAFVPRLAATHDRYLTWAPPASSFEKGYLFMQLEPDWPALAMERGTLFGAHDTLGYNPVQLRRYWDYIRVRSPLPVFYNASVIDVPTLRDMRLLGARYLVVPTGIEPPLDGSVVARAQGYDLFEVTGWQPRVSVVPNFRVVPTETGALRTVLPSSFDPAALAVLERDPGVEPTPEAEAGDATYRETSPESVTIDVRATAPSIVVVRTVFDDGWQATVDGQPAEVIPTDGFLQGVAVPSGDHQLRLTYRDPAVSAGVRAGIVGWGALALAALVASFVQRRRARTVSSKRPPGAGARIR
ncbi:MAG TPA: hypothetical protein VG993_03010 [Actinomycetota bacterium]|nr:hypothetical protein [Actinomycetota bacterium]